MPDQPANSDPARPTDSLDPSEVTPSTAEVVPTVVAQAVQQITQELFSGPIPPASELAGYEAIQSGFADRIVVMAEKEQAWRHESGRSIIANEAEQGTRGQRSALFVALAVLVLAGLFAVRGYAWPGAFVGGADLTALVTIFIVGRRPPPELPG